jgi:hypothetical protein
MAERRRYRIALDAPDKSELPEWVNPRELPADWAARRSRDISRGNRFSPFLLLSYRQHPLVVAHLTSTRKRALAATIACLAVPLLALVAVLVSMALPGRVPAMAYLAGVFLCVWTLFMFLGAAMASASSTVAERDSGTAIQLVLSRIGRRPIAAAKVLPFAPVFTAGVLAALPLYLLIGGSGCLMIGGNVPAFWMFWPWRLLALGASDWQLQLSPLGVLLGLVACLSDACAVWAAAHWGAGLAVRMGSMILSAVNLVTCVLKYALFVIAAWGLCVMIGGAVTVGLNMLVHLSVGEDMPTGVARIWGSLWGAAGYCAGCWIFLRASPVRYVLTGFEHFDRLADEEFKPRLRDKLSFKAWREHLFTGRS